MKSNHVSGQVCKCKNSNIPSTNDNYPINEALVYFGFLVTSSGAQEVTLAGLGTIWGAGVKLRPVTCQVSALSTIVLLWPLILFSLNLVLQMECSERFLVSRLSLCLSFRPHYLILTEE